MGMLPKGFGLFRESKNKTIDPLKNCSIANCPICKREFYRDNTHQTCNMCKVGMVWDDKTKQYTYYPGLDKSKQNKDEV